MNLSNTIKIPKSQYWLIGLGLLAALSVGALSAINQNFLFSLIPVFLLAGVAFLILLFREPFVGLVACILYTFFMNIPTREIGGFQYGLVTEALLIATWASVWYNAKKLDLSMANNNFVWLTGAWFILSCAELVNPSGANPQGWLQEIRGTALYPFLAVPLGSILINNQKRLNFFITIFIVCSVIACLNGIKQQEIGFTAGEQNFLNTGGDVTHFVDGRMRIFSFYDASQFGPLMAFASLVCFILAVGIKPWWKKIILLIIGILTFYGMMISGTRGALFVLIAGVPLALLLSKNRKVIFFGGVAAALSFAFLKFTTIGNTNYAIFRLRTAINPSDDASFNVRVINQLKLAEYMESKPFGEGLGTIGHWGREFNPGKYVSTIAPDSYWVKVWVMYGIVGMILFFCMWMFFIGKSSAMIWKVKNKNVRVKLIALTAGAAGIFLSSYGNEVMNTMPSSLILNLSLGAAFVFCIKDRKEQELNL